VKIEVETIDLKKATAYLKKNIAFSYDSEVRTNRPVTLSRVNTYAIEMLAGRWVLTNQGIGFDKRGFLVDGQKRLMALVQAATEGAGEYEANPDITFETLVTRGLGDNVFPVIDTGENRGSHQILAMNGIRNGLPTAAGARLIYNFDTVADIERWGYTRVPNSTILEMVQNYKLPKYSQHVAPLKKIGLIGSSGIAGMYLCSRYNDEASPHSIDEFVQDLFTGTQTNGRSLLVDDPRWAFREYLIRSMTGPKARRGRDPIVQLMIFIKCWNDHVLGRRRAICAWRVTEGIIRPVGRTK